MLFIIQIYVTQYNYTNTKESSGRIRANTWILNDIDFAQVKSHIKCDLGKLRRVYKNS